MPANTICQRATVLQFMQYQRFGLLLFHWQIQGKVFSELFCCDPLPNRIDYLHVLSSSIALTARPTCGGGYKMRSHRLRQQHLPNLRRALPTVTDWIRLMLVVALASQAMMLHAAGVTA